MNLSYAQIKKKNFGSSYDPTTTKMKDNKKKRRYISYRRKYFKEMILRLWLMIWRRHF